VDEIGHDVQCGVRQRFGRRPVQKTLDQRPAVKRRRQLGACRQPRTADGAGRHLCHGLSSEPSREPPLVSVPPTTELRSSPGYGMALFESNISPDGLG
jgi:hypothetical protein